MKKIIAILFSLLTAAHASAAVMMINSYYVGATVSSIVDGPLGPPVAATYGADADGGEVDDPTLAPTFSLGTQYYAGNMVNNGSGTYYYCLKSNTNAPLANTTYWRQITNVYYFDTASGNDSNGANTCTTAGTTNAATAKANPCQTTLRASDLLNTSGSPNNATAPNGSLILLKRGQTYAGQFFFQGASSSATFILGAWGTGARPLIQHAISGSSQVDGDATVKLAGAGSPNGGGIVRNVTIDSQYVVVYRYTQSVGSTFANGDVITRVSDGAKQGTVQEQRTFQGNTYISVIHTTPTDYLSNSDSFQTAGGAKVGQLNASTGLTLMAGVQSSQPNWSLWNFTVKNTVSNGIGGGTYGNMSKGVNITLYNGTIQDSGMSGGNGAGTDIQYGSNVKVIHLTLKDNGANATYAHNLYYDDINNLEIGYVYSYMTRGDRGNHCMVFHGTMDGGWIHDNLMDSCQNGLGVNDGYNGSNANGAEGFTNWVIERNKIINQGFYAGPGLTMDIAGMSSSYIVNNLGYGNGYPVNIKDRNYTTGGLATPASSNLTVGFNTFLSNASSTASVLKVAGANLNNFQLISNILVGKSASASNYSFERDTTAANGQVHASYNLMYNANFTGTIRWNANTYQVSALPGAVGEGSNSTASAPSFVNEGAANYALNGGSPAKNTGTPVTGYTTDFVSASRSVSTPSMGAYE